MKNSPFILSLVGLSLMSLSTPRSVHAQSTESAEIRSTPIKLNTEGATLYSALKTLFGQAKADFTITNSLKTLHVTVQINQPFRIALGSVLKATGQPIDYTVENGVYHIARANSNAPDIIAESPVEEMLLPPTPRVQMRVLRVRNGSGLEIAALLGANFVPWIASFYPPYVQTNPFAQTMFGGAGFGGGGLGNGGFGGMGNNSGGGAAMGLANGFSGIYALPGLGLGLFGGSLDQGSGDNNGNGGR